MTLSTMCWVKNVNAISKYADLDQTGNETTWGHGGFGEPGRGLVGLVRVKPGTRKEGQVVLTSDVHWIYHRFYLHWHNLHDKPVG
jgi:hypothetical protein